MLIPNSRSIKAARTSAFQKSTKHQLIGGRLRKYDPLGISATDITFCVCNERGINFLQGIYTRGSIFYRRPPVYTLSHPLRTATSMHTSDGPPPPRPRQLARGKKTIYTSPDNCRNMIPCPQERPSCMSPRALSGTEVLARPTPASLRCWGLACSLRQTRQRRRQQQRRRKQRRLRRQNRQEYPRRRRERRRDRQAGNNGSGRGNNSGGGGTVVVAAKQTRRRKQRRLRARRRGRRNQTRRRQNGGCEISGGGGGNNCHCIIKYGGELGGGGGGNNSRDKNKNRGEIGVGGGNNGGGGCRNNSRGGNNEIGCGGEFSGSCGCGCGGTTATIWLCCSSSPTVWAAPAAAAIILGFWECQCESGISMIEHRHPWPGVYVKVLELGTRESTSRTGL